MTALPESHRQKPDLGPNQRLRIATVNEHLCVRQMFAFSRKLFSPLQCDLARNYFYFSLTWTSNHQLFLHPYTNVAHFWLVHQWGRVVPIVVDSAHMWADHKGDPERLFLTVFLASKQAQLHLIKRVILFILLVWFLWLLCMSPPVCWLIQLHRRIQNLTVNNNVYSQTLSSQVRFDATEHYWHLQEGCGMGLKKI